MMPPADRIHSDPGQGVRKVPSDTADLDFQAVGPALRILQLNVEGLSAIKFIYAYDNNNTAAAIISAFIRGRQLSITAHVLLVQVIIQYAGIMSQIRCIGLVLLTTSTS